MGASLRGSDLREANLQGANLSMTDMSEANLCGANLIGANLRFAKLSGADLHGANLCAANLSNAYLTGANFTMELKDSLNLHEAIYEHNQFPFLALNPSFLEHCKCYILSQNNDT